MRLNTIEREGQLPRYDVVTKRIAPEHAVTGTITMPEGRNLVMFYEAGRLAIRASPMRGKIAAVIGTYPRPFVIERLPVRPFTFQPAYIVAPEDAVAITVEGYGTLEPATIPGYALAASTMHDAPYNQLFGAHTALLRWAEANGLRPLGVIREVYLRDRDGERPPLVEVQMPLTG